ncbi:MAG: hypothetical protein H7Y43_14285 [Akkermansiaceae bacterium]|nr:hypothetical protein [Verrucomicrobiales bacterium]
MLWLASLALVLFQIVAGSQRVSAATTAMIFCNGDMGSANGLTPSQINGLRASGMTTMIIFTMGVAPNGDFTYGGTICSNGVYVGPANWGSLLNQCRTQPSSITRIEMCIGAWGDPSWTNIKNLIAANGTNSSTVLYRNLVALKNALGIDAIDNDDESAYDSGSAIKFGQMCGSVGLKLTLCPYTNPGYWQAVKAGLGNICDQVYLQCYDGGAGNNPATWNTYFGGLKVIPGYWDWERDTTFLTKMQAGKNAGCTGGFYWPSCTGCNPPAEANGMKFYADWILNTFNPVVKPVTAADVVGSQVAFTADFGGGDLSYQWQVIRGGVTNNIPGATNTTLTLANLQLTNTASYQLQASNAAGVSVSSAGSLTVSSVPAAVNNVIAVYAAQTGLGSGFAFTPTWTIAPGSMIYGQTPSSTNGNFNLEPFGGGRSVNALTAGDSLTISQTGGVTSTNYLTCGNGSSAGSSVIYTLTNTSAGGYSLTNITVYGGWLDAGRDQQAYTVYYSKVSAPTTFILLRSVNYNPANAANVPSATRATLTPASGALATNVAAVKFDFASPAAENGYCGYAEIGLFGVPVSPVVATNSLPVTAADVVGSQVTFTAAFTAASPLAFQWQKISGGTTNIISGATNTTLTLTNLQLTDTASYQLRATNAFGIAVSKASSLTVGGLPAAVNNVVTAIAAQTGPGSGTFTPTWTVTTNNSLIAGQSPGSMSGSFTLEIPGRSVNSLTDGGDGALTLIPATVGYTTTQNYVTCGNGNGAGASVTYTLTGSTNGYSLTNLTVYGGWADAGRDQQAWTVTYSKVAAPTTFLSLGSINYNPANAANAQSATRATLLPATGVLATNVAAVKFDFTTMPSENGYCGYAEIILSGFPTPVLVPVATNPTNIMIQLAANNLTLNWPSDHIGWRLQVQTNGLAQGLGTNWVDVAGSSGTNQMSLPINPDSNTSFYRLIFP